MTTKVIIYTRFSSDMQRTQSCVDQERVVRAGLDRLRIDHRDAMVIKDEATPGTRVDRDGFQQLLETTSRQRGVIVAVDDMSRLTRGQNAVDFVTDLVFRDGRFLSVAEGIDTHQPGWELGAQVLEVHHSASNRNTAHNVHRGMEGNVLNGLSAGDVCFGYCSEFRDENWQEQFQAGRKPARVVLIHEDEADWVRRIFSWFIGDKLSLREIARRLTKAGVKNRRSGKDTPWSNTQVRNVLSNTKYIGRWPWGATQVQRDSRGRKRRKKTPDRVVVHDRPQLRIIDQKTWDAAQARLAELYEVFGPQPGQNGRGAQAHASEVYPRHVVSGLIHCGLCGRRMIIERAGELRYLSCPNYRAGVCTCQTRVPVAKAEPALVDFVADILSRGLGSIGGVVERVRRILEEDSETLEPQLDHDRRKLTNLERQLDNLVSAIAEEGLDSAALRERLSRTEADVDRLRQQIAEQESVVDGSMDIPSDEEIARELANLASRMHDDPQLKKELLRMVLGRVTAHPVIPRGRKRGWMKLRFRVQPWDVLRAAIDSGIPDHVLMAARQEGDSGGLHSPEFEIDLGAPSRLDRWAEQIVAWREEGVKWREIRDRTGLRVCEAHRAWKRYTSAPPSGAA